MVARCMALELGEHRIRVNVVATGIVNAGMARRQIEIDPAFARKAAKGIPLGTLQTAEQVAGAVAFLCSDEAEAVTGTTLLVDGALPFQIRIARRTGASPGDDQKQITRYRMAGC